MKKSAILFLLCVSVCLLSSGFGGPAPSDTFWFLRYLRFHQFRHFSCR